jgi:hypothetical protein
MIASKPFIVLFYLFRRILIDTSHQPECIDLLEKTLKEENALISRIIGLATYHVKSTDPLKEKNLVTEDCEVLNFPKNQQEEESETPIKSEDLKETLEEIEVEGFKLKILTFQGIRILSNSIIHGFQAILIDEKSQCVFSVDTILGKDGVDFTFNINYFDYLKSLKLIFDSNPKVIYPARGDVISVEEIQYYIDQYNEIKMQMQKTLIEHFEKFGDQLNIIRKWHGLYYKGGDISLASFTVALNCLDSLVIEGKAKKWKATTSNFYRPIPQHDQNMNEMK